MDAPYITIIIPTFNAEKTLQASLDSVLGQTFRDFEILIMDGGSKDSTIAIAQNAIAADKNAAAIIPNAAKPEARIRLFAEPDKGVYDAMNKGIREARGTWIYFLGSDDFLYEPTTLSNVFPHHAATNPIPAPHANSADFLYGNVISPSYKGLYDGEFSLTKLLRRNISHQAIFYRRTLFDRIPAYNLRYKGYADWELNIRLFSDASVHIHYIGGIIARFGPDGLSSRHDIPFLQEILFPEKLRLLNHTGLRALRPIAIYDEWWRLLRNAEIPSPAEFFTSTALTGYAGPIPAPISDMATWQQKIPRRLLTIGICSKIVMFASYLSHLLTGALK